MDLECRLCNGNKIATSFDNLDGLQAHLFSNHHDGPLYMFQFVCHKCEFKFGTEYRLLRHEQTCGRESRSEEDIEKIRYKLKMYELLEATLKYNMTKHLISVARPANQYNIGTLKTRESPQTQCQTESLGTKIIKSVIPESLENPVSNSRRENREKNVIPHESSKRLGNLRTVKAEVQDQHCSIDSATSTQSYVKTEPEDVDTPDVEILGSIEIRKRKASSKPTEHISQRSSGIAHQNVNSAGESINLRHAKQAKKNLNTSNAQPRTVGGIPLWKQYLLGSPSDESQIPGFNSMRDQEERLASSTAPNLTNVIHVKGPRPKKEELQAYFSQFGKINSVTIRNLTNKAMVIFDSCDSAAKCIQQRTHKIRGQDFIIFETTTSEAMIKKLGATWNLSKFNQSNVTVPNNQIHLPRGLRNRILVDGPLNSLLHSKEICSLLSRKALQKKEALQNKELRTYFGQFGKVIFVCFQLRKLRGKIEFENCEAATRCIQQRNHKICGRDFIVRTGTPTKG